MDQDLHMYISALEFVAGQIMLSKFIWNLRIQIHEVNEK